MRCTETQILDIVTWKMENKTWDDVTSLYNKKYKSDLSSNAIRHMYRSYGSIVEVSEEDDGIQTLKELSRAKNTKSRQSRQNKKLLDYISSTEELTDIIGDIVQGLNKRKTKPLASMRSPSTSKGLRRMTMEILLSDIHYGKETKTFNLEICRERMRYFTDSAIQDFRNKSKTFNVEKIILALLGDIIESATMHGLESARGCEFGNSRQVQEAIVSIFEDVMEPLAQLGVPIHCPCVTGNHDRTEHARTYNNPGEENLTWIIYKTLELLSNRAGYSHITFDVPTEPYTTVDIYGNVALYEHYDNAKANTRVALEALMMKRQKQLKKVVNFMRGGHFHEATMFGRGTIITNGSVPGQDSYATVMGFDSEASQFINYYIETSTRPTCFYSSFVVYLP